MNKIIIEQVAKHRKEAETLVRAFYDHPEISMEETASSRAIVDALAPYGFRFFVKFWGAKVSMHSWRGHALNTVRVLFRCVC